ncbi:MAG: nucleotidyltransferase domain-containing protein [bacterium]
MAKKNDSRIILKIVKSYLNILQENRIRIIRAYLFGSYAKNKFTKDSDIDLAIVSQDFKGDVIEDNLRLMRLRRSIDLRIEPHAFTPKEFSIHNPFVREILKTAKRIA